MVALPPHPRTRDHKIKLASDDTLTAIQIYGSDPQRLAEAARRAEEAHPLFLDLNTADDNSAVRNPGLVFVAGLIGVPWQDIATPSSDRFNTSA